ncbi:MAG: CoA pyrophosphatase [Acidimicrobiaceae bacterium]|nr:CoA pyrophosphatase [Acidimicrobiaceae bacterium]
MAAPAPGAEAPVSALPVELPGRQPRPAAVLCAVFDDDGQAAVVLTRRSSRLRSHTSEVSFPGGRLDDGEAPASAALREAWEEVGIAPGSVELIGQLHPLTTPLNPAPIMPFVGVLDAAPALSPNPAEVERAFTVTLAELFRPGVYHDEVWSDQRFGGDRVMCFFRLEGDIVWGATARMLRDLLDRMWATTVRG